MIVIGKKDGDLLYNSVIEGKTDIKIHVDYDMVSFTKSNSQETIWWNSSSEGLDKSTFKEQSDIFNWPDELHATFKQLHFSRDGELH